MSFAGVGKLEEVVMTPGDIETGIRKMANWKTPEPDWGRGYWFKNSPHFIYPLQWLCRLVCHLG